jgi:hypothetical protein
VSRPVGRVLCPACAGRRSSIWDCRCRQPRAVYPRASGGQPSSTRAGRLPKPTALLTLLRVGFTEPPQSPAALVVSYTTVSPLPFAHPLGCANGGLFSVALSRGSPRVDVIDHPAVWSPDLPHRTAKARRDRPADSPVMRIPPRAPGVRTPVSQRAGRLHHWPDRRLGDHAPLDDLGLRNSVAIVGREQFRKTFLFSHANRPPCRRKRQG